MTRLFGLLFACLLLLSPAADAKLSVTNLSGFGGVSSETITPDELANLELWYRADVGVTDAGGGAVSAWGDKSGNLRNLSQGTSGNRPTLSASDADFGGQASITCDGSNDYLVSSTFGSVSQPLHVFIIMKQVSWNGSDEILTLESDNSTFIKQETATPQVQMFAGSSGHAQSLTLGTGFLYNAFFNGASSKSALNNGSYDTPGSVGTAALTGVSVCASFAGTVPANVAVAEIIAYSAEITGDDLTNLLGYLRSRYGLW